LARQIDFRRIRAQCEQAGVEHFFVEDERKHSPREHAEATLAYAKPWRILAGALLGGH
jgi:hypothetical protein